MMQVYATYRNSDMIEGKGSMVMDKVFFEEDDAFTYINRQQGVFGRTLESLDRESWSELGDWQVKPLLIMEHLEDGEEFQRQKLIESAYSKLSGAEQRALGLQREIAS